MTPSGLPCSSASFSTVHSRTTTRWSTYAASNAGSVSRAAGTGTRATSSVSPAAASAGRNPASGVLP